MRFVIVARRFVIVAVLLSWAVWAQAASDETVNGQWQQLRYPLHAQLNPNVFRITLKVKNGVVTGHYCAIDGFGARLDCGVGNRLHGKREADGSLRLSLVSARDADASAGIARITRKGNRLHWRLVSAPDAGVSLARHNALLTRLPQAKVSPISLAMATRGQFSQKAVNCYVTPLAAGETDRLRDKGCGGAEFKHQDARLNRVYRQRRDAANNPNAVAALRQSERAWIAFKTSDCKALSEYSASRGANCRLLKTTQRAAELAPQPTKRALFFAVVASHYRPDYRDCMDASLANVDAMRACITAEWHYQDQRLNKVYRQLSADITQVARKRLRLAERDWINYRDANGDFHRQQWAQRSPLGVDRVAETLCRLRMTTARRLELFRHWQALRWEGHAP